MTQQNPLVSIIVRTKDRPKLLKRALQSINGQTYRPIEAVVVNDGGCELDVDELKGLAGNITVNYKRLEKNTGRAHAGNVGMESALGSYIGFLDDDDELYPRHIETLVAFLEQSEYKIAYADTEVVARDFDPESKTVVDRTIFVFEKNFSYGDLLIENFIPFNSLLFSRDALRETGTLNEDFELYEDWDFLIRAAQRFSFFHISGVSARYIQWSDDLQINKSDNALVRTMHHRIIQKYHELITPSVILKLKQEKEGALLEQKNLTETNAQLAADLARFQDIAQDNKLRMSEQDLRIRGLEEEVAGKDSRIRGLEEEVAGKDSRIRNLEGALSDAMNAFHQVTGTAGWQVLEKLRYYRGRIAPDGSGRRRLYDIGIKGLRVLKRDGFKLFLVKAVSKLKRSVGGEKLANGPTDYEQWISQREIRDTGAIREEIEGFGYKPKISIITPVYNVEPVWLDRCIESVLGQYYERWELCIHDDSSSNRKTLRCLKKWRNRDSRIKLSFGERNEGISAASNYALRSSTGEFIALLDNDDMLSPDALYENVKLLNVFPDTDLVYSDEDRITGRDDNESGRFDPFFKPDWSPQLMFACMYTGHLSVYRKSVVEDAGGFRPEYDFSQDYDLALRITEKTTRIKHIPKILYHWRAVPSSSAAGGKNFARTSNIAALRSAVGRRGYDAEVLEYPFANRVKFVLRKYPLVSIIIPTDSERNIFNCLDLLLKNTSYPSFEIIVVTNAALGERIVSGVRSKGRIRICNFDKPFNFSLKCNEGAAAAHGEYILFLNDDIEAIHATWLEDMVAVFGKGKVGGVSPKLFYEDDTIQYAGMITGVRGLVGTAFHCQPKDSGYYFNMIQSERNVSLLSGACLLMPKKIFEEVGGFDSVNMPIMHSDLDLCCKLREKGYELIYTPFAALRHIGHLALREAESAGRIVAKNKLDLFAIKKWGDYLSSDPFFTDNMRNYLYQNGDIHYRLYAGRQNEEMFSARDLLFVTHDLSLSGAPLLLFNLACDLKRRGFFVAVMSPCDGPLAEDFKKEDIPLMIEASIQGAPLEETRNFMANFDLILINTIVMWQTVLAAKENKVPVVWMLHESRAGLEIAESNGRMRAAFNAADDVIFACKASASLYDKFNMRNNFRIINYGTRPLQAGRVGEAQRGSDKLVIVQVGSIEPRKGQDILIRSVAALPEKHPPLVEVYIVGRRLDNDESRAFYATIRKLLDGRNNIHLIDEVPHEKIGEILEKADIFVCSSRDEVFPLTVLEAMSIGKAIISTDVGGVPVMIRDKEEGIIVPNEDSDALARAIVYLYENREEAKRLGENARKKFFDNFTIEKFTENFLAAVGGRLHQRGPVQ